MSVVLNIGEDDYLTDIIGDESGARIAVHSHNVLPHPDEKGYLAQPGQLTSFGVKKVVLKRKDPPHGTCTKRKKLRKKDMYSEKYNNARYSKQVLGVATS